MKHKKFNLVGTVMVLSALAACGGGDGGSATSPSPTPNVPQPTVVVVPPESSASTLVTAVGLSNYAIGSEAAAAYDKLNAERKACGFGLLAQNLKLDTAAKGHANWNVLNGYVGHFQTAGSPGFTGITADDRIEVAGYGFRSEFKSADESITRFSPSVSGLGKSGIATLLNAPYHAVGLLSSYKDVGISVLSPSDVAGAKSPGATLQVNLAYKNAEKPQLLDGTAVATYPCEGATDIDRQLSDESPSPVPGRDLSRNPLGSSVFIAVRDGNTLSITNASITNLVTGLPVSLRPVLNSASDPNKVGGKSSFGSHHAFIVADTPLSANTRYQVVISGTNNDLVFNRNFIFTTGSGG